MRTISQIVEGIMGSSPLLAEVIYEDIGNISSIARLIQPQVEKKLYEEVSEEAIAMALRRMKMKKKPKNSGSKFLKDLQNISVRSNLTEFVCSNGGETTKIHQEILRKLENKKGIFLNISRGLFESIILVSSNYEKEVSSILKRQKTTKVRDLSAITIQLSEETITTPGVYYLVLKTLAWNGINLIEIISIGSELSIIFRNNDVDRAFSVIKSLAK